VSVAATSAIVRDGSDQTKGRRPRPLEVGELPGPVGGHATPDAPSTEEVLEQGHAAFEIVDGVGDAEQRRGRVTPVPGKALGGR
jgi:hypothetical protein